MAGPTLAPKLRGRILKLAAKGQSVESIRKAVGLNWHTVKKVLDNPDATTPPKPPPTRTGAGSSAKAAGPEPDPIEAASERLNLKRVLGREKDLVKQIASERSFRGFLEDLVRDVAHKVPPGPAYRPPRALNHASLETPILHLSDWHAYEVVKRDRVLGLNEYDAGIFGRRARRVVESVLSIKAKMERGGGWHWPDLVVALNGDFVSGTIHEVERHSDADNIVLATFGCGMVLASALRDLAPHFRSIKCVGTSGNHGRLPDARRMQQKDPTRSWDTAVYLYAKTALADVPNVDFLLPDAYSVVYTVEGWRFFQGHGHQVKSWNSIPYYGISRLTNGLNALRVASGESVHYWLFGHFHDMGQLSLAGGEAFVNGSLIGASEFGVNDLGRASKPSQTLMLVHPEHGVTSRWPILAGCPDDAAGYEADPWVHMR